MIETPADYRSFAFLWQAKHAVSSLCSGSGVLLFKKLQHSIFQVGYSPFLFLKNVEYSMLNNKL
jgi:hypothetical protein